MYTLPMLSRVPTFVSKDYAMKRLIGSACVAIALVSGLAVSAVNAQTTCRTDSFGTTRCNDGTTYRTDSFGTTRDNNGNSWRTDSFGTTRGSDGSTCRSDSFGTLRCSDY